jgi:tRNA threonylcarbamoyladenosine biosynthesis protein TsaB
VNIVALETATETVGVAVRTAAGVEAELALTGRRRHVESLTPALEHLLGQVGLRAADLDAIAVDIGPGLFTGLRVGVAAAKGLAQSLGLGLVVASSLDVLLAAAAEAGHHGWVCAAVDARRGELFAAVRDVDVVNAVDAVDGVEAVEAGLFSPEKLANALRVLTSTDGGVLAVGDGAQRYAALLEAVPGVAVVAPALAYPPPSTLLALAAARLDAGATPVPAAGVVPLYMREADATSNFARADRA